MAKKTESTLKNMLVALFVIAFISSTTLGYVYEFTKGPISDARLKKKVEAIKIVVPEFTNNPNLDSYKIPSDMPDSLECYPAYKDSTLVGTAIRTFSDIGFSKRIYLMVGFLPNGTIHNISVLEHSETPGLGDKMDKKKSKWSEQFNGKNPESYKLKVTKDGGNVDAITAATISSRAYAQAVDRAYKAYMANKK
ncbi:MAG: RnfABCDGE type electron transport complex subunit G [Bacteroidales bacterium]|nr:RnfABCDGE type electron transport complex subunit G [Bacteroidales bacterium]MBN2757622.1 RnfABCDGE type electron transport complex subunit G [Bacteroidales bacterium]